MNLLFNVVASFREFEKYGTEGDNIDKSTNAHNCRKSAGLSQMFAIHKMISMLKADIGITSRLAQLFNSYASAYIELPSMVSDLVMYGLYLTQEQKEDLFTNVLAQALSAKEANKLRHSKAQIGVNKLQFILNFKQN